MNEQTPSIVDDLNVGDTAQMHDPFSGEDGAPERVVILNKSVRSPMSLLATFTVRWLERPLEQTATFHLSRNAPLNEPTQMRTLSEDPA